MQTCRLASLSARLPLTVGFESVCVCVFVCVSCCFEACACVYNFALTRALDSALMSSARSRALSSQSWQTPPPPLPLQTQTFKRAQVRVVVRARCSDGPLRSRLQVSQSASQSQASACCARTPRSLNTDCVYVCPREWETNQTSSSNRASKRARRPSSLFDRSLVYTLVGVLLVCLSLCVSV